MKKLGISIYPAHGSLEDTLAYIDLAAKYGFKRVFTCLLSVDGDKDAIVLKLKKTIEHANRHGMEVMADVSPRVFGELGISYNDLSFFKEIGAYGVRLDLGFTGSEESIMTFNPQGLKIELNMSSGTKYIENIKAFKANMENIMACHNFYPHRYTGLSLEHFIKCSKQYKNLGITTAAFINSKSATFGPWPLNEGLCTLEMHRELSIVAQAKHLWATGYIDDVIIANCFASEEELKTLSEIDPYCLTLNIEMAKDVPEVERKILFEELHFNRGDVSDYVIRSTQSRVKFKGHNFVPFNTVNMERGHVAIETSLYAHYAGELHLVKKAMNNTGKTNIVGKIVTEEQFLLDYIEPWQKFKLKLK